MNRTSATSPLLGTNRIQGLIAAFALAAIVVHLLLRFGTDQTTPTAVQATNWPLLAALVLGGGPLLLGLAVKLLHGEFGSDLLAGLSIVTAMALSEYLAGAVVVLMLAGGEALEGFAVRRASFALEGLARRLPALAHRCNDGKTEDVALDEVHVGDHIVILPHEACPVDGMVIEGHGFMDEQYLTGEPYVISKAPGSPVLSGAVNGDTALIVRTDRLAADSRYARIMEVMRASEQQRPRLRRMGDQLGALYTPLALAVAFVAWALSGEARRFLAVLVVATPCPLLIAIPVAIIGAVSLSARRGIVIRDPAVLERVDTCRTAIFDKTGTLTYGRPVLTEVLAAELSRAEVLGLAASLERYSRHPLSGAVLDAAAAEGIVPFNAGQVSEPPGQGLTGRVENHQVQITSRAKFSAMHPDQARVLPPAVGGLECVVAIDGRYAATLRFRDEPRAEGASFVGHLAPSHHLERVLMVSGDREAEVRYLAGRVGIREIHAGQSPEQKVAIVREETQRADTLFLGDGVNDAPALATATVGIAFGQNSDVAAEAAGAVILDCSLEKVDELLHIGRRLRRIALQSAVGGMALSMLGMALAGLGWLPPVAGALFQEAIDVAAVLNALRTAVPWGRLSDYAVE